MATTSKNIKGFYRQKKNPTSGGISKSKSSKPSSSKKLHAATFGSDVTLIDLQDDYDENEQVLRQFDMNMAYGPCLGMTRLARWERAQRLGLNPPQEIQKVLKSADAAAAAAAGGGKVELEECLWAGRV